MFWFLKQKHNQFRPTYFFDPNTFRLKEQRFIVPGSSQSLSIKYPKFQKMEGKTLPKEIEISVFDGSNLGTNPNGFHFALIFLKT